MNAKRWSALAARYRSLRIAVLGDFCLDRYLEIAPSRAETSIETGLNVHNVVRVRAQAGAAGTILNNLVALGIGQLHPLGCCGDDGEGYELRRSLDQLPRVDRSRFITAADRRTFTYCKPLVLAAGQPPRELNRLDTKNWTPTPATVESQLIEALEQIAPQLDALIVMDQVDLAETGVVTRRVLEAIGRVAQRYPAMRIVGDSRRGLHDWPAITLKMNAAELAKLSQRAVSVSLDDVRRVARELAQRNGSDVFVTLAERGIVGATADGACEHAPALPVRGAIDIVGAGDSVTANLTAALTADATLAEALELAMTAASLVIHQLGTTGTATSEQIAKQLATP